VNDDEIECIEYESKSVGRGQERKERQKGNVKVV
jgi:hypothetical protein